ncbi:hypothetical protein Bbelb_100940 [Branchiostoma belcheri]|nr:hypothetical protein Bbelb_100940 [Branchiostoma belcheri]
MTTCYKTILVLSPNLKDYKLAPVIRGCAIQEGLVQNKRIIPVRFDSCSTTKSKTSIVLSRAGLQMTLLRLAVRVELATYQKEREESAKRAQRERAQRERRERERRGERKESVERARRERRESAERAQRDSAKGVQRERAQRRAQRKRRESAERAQRERRESAERAQRERGESAERESAKRAQRERAQRRAQRERRESAERAQRERRESAGRTQRERRESADRAQRERRESAERAQRERREIAKKAQRERKESAERAQSERRESAEHGESAERAQSADRAQTERRQSADRAWRERRAQRERRQSTERAQRERRAQRGRRESAKRAQREFREHGESAERAQRERNHRDRVSSNTSNGYGPSNEDGLRPYSQNVTTSKSIKFVVEQCCNSCPDLAQQALKPLNSLLSGRSLTRSHIQDAEEVLNAEESLRNSILHKREVLVSRQMSRMKVHANLVYHIGIMAETGAIEIDKTLTKSLTSLEKKICKGQEKTLEAKYTKGFAKGAIIYIKKVQEDKIDLSSSPAKAAKRIEHCEEDFDLSDLATFLKSHALNEKAYVCHSTELIFQVLRKKVMQEETASSRHLDLLQMVINAIYMDTRKLSKETRAGLLLSGAQILTDIALNHQNKGIRVQAVRGISRNNLEGLSPRLWSLQWENKVIPQMVETCSTLCLESKDAEIRRIAADHFLVSSAHATEVDSQNNNPPLNEKKLFDTTVGCISRHLQEKGHSHNLLQADMSTKTDATYIVPATVDGNPVNVEFGRFRKLEDLVKPPLQSPTSRSSLENAIKILSKIRHSNVISILDSSTVNGGTLLHYMVTERMDKGGFSDYLEEMRRSVRIVSNVTQFLLKACAQIAGAISHLTRYKVVHRDVLAANVAYQEMQDGQLRCCLTNFNLARVMRRKSSESDTKTSTYVCLGVREDPIALRWSALESLQDDIFTEATEVWMLGCFTYEVLTLGAHPFPECLEAESMKRYLEDGHLCKKPSCIPEDVFSILQDCWNSDQTKRPTADKIERCLLDQAENKFAKGDSAHMYTTLLVQGEGVIRRKPMPMTMQQAENSETPVSDDPPYVDTVVPERDKQIHQTYDNVPAIEVYENSYMPLQPDKTRDSGYESIYEDVRSSRAKRNTHPSVPIHEQPNTSLHGQGARPVSEPPMSSPSRITWL